MCHAEKTSSSKPILKPCVFVLLRDTFATVRDSDRKVKHYPYYLVESVKKMCSNARAFTIQLCFYPLEQGDTAKTIVFTCFEETESKDAQPNVSNLKDTEENKDSSRETPK